MAKAFREVIGVSPSTATTKDSVLVIIDAQNEYATGHLETKNVDSTRRTISSLLQKYRDADGDIVHIVHKTAPGAPVFTPDTELAKVFSELEPNAREKVVEKQFPGSFTGTNLGAIIKDTGKNKLVLTGYMAHVCVSTTARQAAEQGYDVLIVADAVGDRDIPGAEAELVVKITLAELGDAFATIVESSSIS
ncbi:Isochorismatase-like protein [Lipomyces tetrasporus]|uniref:Isochorismatase-like protein n=1 Tax=Lipomyces tetrasporus TaxID=54092 RepID=A0AAD7VPL9_9ASCO|nr:Isochorismatase-like protein [Lipomyces tetrasporus]XP_056042426.1 Isochorismatase-like protein [Lipomyces tetrasporus]KAJ8096594.1 Isochorismatase-like protein [Lipomyces tetrasporus]KAJ8098976.1 Isochorismatase-like protein [Lipomyces tetrasporus]